MRNPPMRHARARFVAAVLLCAVASFASALPRILIAQVRVPFKDNDPNLEIGTLIAAQFDEGGKLDAMVWAASDPGFRDAISQKHLSLPDVPTKQAALRAADQLDAEYTMIVEAKKDASRFRATIEVFHFRKSIWKDDANMGVTQLNVTDVDASSRSLARTLVVRFSDGPIKALPVQAKAQTPEPAKGQLPDVQVPDTSPATLAVSMVARAQEFSKAGKQDLAINTLRDAVDASPFDVSLRLALIDGESKSDPAEAARSAREAANLMPDHPEFRKIAAQEWLVANEPSEAHNDLNEAIARAPNDVSTLELLGQVALQEGNPQAALDALNRAVQMGSDPEALFLRALAYARLGSAAPAAKDMSDFLSKQSNSDQAGIARRYEVAADVLDRSLTQSGGDIRSLMQRASVHPTDPAVAKGLGSFLQSSKACASFVTALPTPLDYKTVNGQRILAFRLTIQALVDLQGFAKGGGDDSLFDARIDLGEAIRNATETRQAQERIRAKK